MRVQNRTYFQGFSGEEKQDFSQNYKTDGSTVRNTTVFFYQVGTVAKRAGEAGVDDRLVYTKQFRGGADALASGDVDTTPLKLQNMTYFAGTVGEEKQDYSQNYRTDGTTVCHPTFFYYEGSTAAVLDTRAGAATRDASLIRT